MREMKDSGVAWIGEIPKSWKVVRIKYVIEQSTDGIKIGPFGSALSNKIIADGNYNVYSQANLISGDFSKTKNTIAEETYKSLITYRVVPGDICVSMMGTIGKCKKVPKEICAGIMDSHLIKIRLSDNILPEYFEYVYDKDLGGVCFQQMMYLKKGTIMDGLNTSIVKRFTLPLPDIKTQHCIANYLDRKCSQIDAIIARQQEVIEKLKAYKLSVITEAVTKGLNPNVPMKDSGVEWIGEIPEHWMIGKLCFFTTRIGDGLHGTPKFDDKGEYYFINGNNLGNTYITIKENTKSVNQSEYNKYFIDLDKNTLLISLNGTIGNLSKYRGERIILGKSAGYITLDSKKGLLLDYLRFYLQSHSVKSLFELTFEGTTINNLSLETLRNLPVCIMGKEEQLYIAEFLDEKVRTIDTLINKKQSIIDRLTEYKKSLIYEVVTGKKEV